MSDLTVKLSDRPFPEAALPERLAPPEALDAEQRAAADELIAGPRGGVYGPFRPLLHRPALLRSLGKVGEALRFDGTISPSLREWTICVVARNTSNVFEWKMHVPIAISEGVPVEALEALNAASESPPTLSAELVLARLLTEQMIKQHRITDELYDRAIAEWGETRLVELIVLIGYFGAICWLMNVSRTPGPS